MRLKPLCISRDQLRDRDFRKVNLACGRRIYPGRGWTNLDIVDGDRVQGCDIFNLQWPVPPGSVDYILASHILEHVPHYHPEMGDAFWYHFFPYLLSRFRDGGLLEVWGPDPDRRDTLQYVGHTRLVGPKSFAEYTQPHAKLSSLENLDSRRDYEMELVHLEQRRTIHMGPLNDYHFEHHLGPGWRDRVARLVGRKDELRMVYRIRRVGE